MRLEGYVELLQTHRQGCIIVMDPLQVILVQILVRKARIAKRKGNLLRSAAICRRCNRGQQWGLSGGVLKII